MVANGKVESSRPRHRRRLLLSVTAFLAVVFLAWSLDHSGGEFEAVRWHRHHGPTIVANGVSFPLYYWHVPSESDHFGFEIEDKPGPLRPGRDGMAFIDVNRPEHDHPRGQLTAAQMVQRQVEGYRNSHYPESTTFTLTVAGEPLQCMRNDYLSTVVYCYGDGRIVHVFFAGNKSQLAHFNQMMAGARKL